MALVDSKQNIKRKIRIENEGIRAHLDGKKLEDNPYLSAGARFMVYAGIWEKGFNKIR